MKLIPNHPELPPLPEGQFWRVYEELIFFGAHTVVELRQRRRWLGDRLIERQIYENEAWVQTKRMDAIMLAHRIVDDLEEKRTNVLGDLEGDHPA